MSDSFLFNNKYNSSLINILIVLSNLRIILITFERNWRSFPKAEYNGEYIHEHKMGVLQLHLSLLLKRCDKVDGK